MIEITLPYPPSVNKTWAQGKKTGRVYLTPKVREYRQRVKEIVLTGSHDKKLTCDISYSSELFPPNDQRKRDLDNHFKCVWDALEHAGVYQDDSQIKVIESVVMREPVASPRIVITIKKLEPSPAIQLRYKPHVVESDYQIADLDRMQKIFQDRGFVVSRSDIYQAWSDYCEAEHCAHWVALYDQDEAVFDACMECLCEVSP